MDRALWETWRRTPTGAARDKLLSDLLESQEAFVQYCVTSFAKKTNYYTDNMRADLEQAARIGVLAAITEKWRPSKGMFSTCAYYWVWHEMQLVVRHATGLSVPKSAFLPKKKQDEIAKFYAQHGREPMPEEVGLTAVVMDRARKATATFAPLSEADDIAASDDAPAPEEVIDRQRDAAALREFAGSLRPKDRKEFWAGDRPDLAEQAKAFIEERRSKRT